MTSRRPLERLAAGKRCTQEWHLWRALSAGRWWTTREAADAAGLSLDVARKRLEALRAGGWPLGKGIKKVGNAIHSTWRRMDV